MGLLYKSTRSSRTATASEAILKGLSEDGGLFVPERIPALDKTPRELGQMSYGEVAYEVMKLFLADFTEEELKSCIEGAYDEKFDTEVIAPLVEAEGVWFLELFHGKTIAFKDMALSILPYLMITAAKKNHVDREIVILTATSGDTGKAAMAGFADVPGTKIIVFYPKNGVSPIQERQMVTQKGDNVLVVGFLLPTPSTSAVWFRRSSTMYMRMPGFWRKEGLGTESGSTWWFPPETSGISSPLIMRS